MDNNEVLSLLAAQYSDLSNVEKRTEEILYAPADDFSDLIDQRGLLLEKAVLVENTLKKAGAENETLRNALNGSAEPGSLSEELKRVYEASLRVKAVLCRIRRLEPQVVTRMENERAEVLSHLEGLNASSNSVAASYSRALQTAVPPADFTGVRSI